MIYVDTSVALAQLLAEDRCPPATLWHEPVLSSRLLAYEVWTRVHALGLTTSHGDAVRRLLGRLAWLELTPVVLHVAPDTLDRLLSDEHPELAVVAAWAVSRRHGPTAKKVVMRALEVTEKLPAALQEAQRMRSSRCSVSGCSHGSRRCR